MGKYEENATTIGQILNDPEMCEHLLKYMPDARTSPTVSMAKGMTLPAVRNFMPNAEAKKGLDDLIAELKAL